MSEGGTRGFPLDLVSRYRSQIYGLSILYIAFFHGNAIDAVDYSFGRDSLMLFRKIMNNGNVGVDIFLFVSGISLYFAHARGPEVYEFLRKRLLRLWLPVAVIYGVYWFVRFALFGHSIPDFISRILMLAFWENGDQSIWFVSLIAVLYLIYPLLYGFLFVKGGAGSLLLRCFLVMAICYLAIISFAEIGGESYEMIEIAITRIPVFILGAALGKFVYEKRRIPTVFSLVFIAGTVFFWWVLYRAENFEGMPRRFFFLLGGVCMAYVFAMIFLGLDRITLPGLGFLTKQILRFFGWVGGFSLELYLAHIMVNQLYRFTDLYIEGDFSRYALMLAIAFVWAWAASRIVSVIKDRCPGIREAFVVQRQGEMGEKRR